MVHCCAASTPRIPDGQEKGMGAPIITQVALRSRLALLLLGVAMVGYIFYQPQLSGPVADGQAFKLVPIEVEGSEV